jgi:NADH-quinone oxidoreductase subunit D
LLHRATEKLAETKTYIQSLALHGSSGLRLHDVQRARLLLGHRKNAGLGGALRAQYIRVMFAEITRMLNHLLWLGAHAHDCGASTVLIYCFREREALFDAYEAVSGARMHAAYFRPGGVYRDLPDSMPQFKPAKFATRAALPPSTKTAKAVAGLPCKTSARVFRPTWTSTKRC